MSIGIEHQFPATWKYLVNALVGRFCQADGIGRQEGGDDRNCDDDRIEERFGHALVSTEIGDDECKFSDLCQRECCLHGGLQWLSRKHHAKRCEDDLSADHEQRDERNGEPVFQEQRRVNHHTHRHEEDGTEHVLDGRKQMFDFLSLDGFGKDAAHDECTERRTEACAFGQEHHTQAETQRHDGERLVVEMLLADAQQGRDKEKARSKPEEQVCSQLAYLPRHLRTVERLIDGQRCQKHHQHDGKEVFDHKDTETYVCKLLLTKAQVIERLEDNRRRRHAEHTAEEERIHLVPSHGATEEESARHHAHHDRKAADERRSAHLHQFLVRELKTEGEQQEDDANLAPDLHAFLIADPTGAENVRAHQQTGHNVAEHYRLFQKLAHQAREACCQHDYTKIMNHKYIDLWILRDIWGY